MTGGAGPDSFAFGLQSGADAIRDFELGTDRFQLLNGQAIASLQARGPDTRVHFADGSTALLLGVAVNDPVALFP
jgi:hypothetical protein